MTKSLKNYTGNETRKMHAFLMRFSGHSYAEIHEETGYTVWTLEQYFYKNGKWFEEYQHWAKARVDDINDRLNNMFTAQAVDAMQQIVNLSRGHATIMIVDETTGKKTRMPVKVSDRTMLDAARDIVDRAGFKPPDRIQFAGDAEDEAEDLLAQMEIMKAEREAEKAHETK